ncbi:hypothetical protein DIZ50_15150 [Legionella pneumophila]|nr:hypothetical protein DIZ50_15150 [Legionella pneumophila]
MIFSRDKATKIFRIAIINKYNNYLYEVWRLFGILLCRLLVPQPRLAQYFQGIPRAALWWLSVAGLWRLYFGQNNAMKPKDILKSDASLRIALRLSQHEPILKPNAEPDHAKNSGFLCLDAVQHKAAQK